MKERRELLPPALPLPARAEVETQGRFILLVLRVVATASRLLAGIAGGTTPILDLQSSAVLPRPFFWLLLGDFLVTHTHQKAPGSHQRGPL